MYYTCFRASVTSKNGDITRSMHTSTLYMISRRYTPLELCTWSSRGEREDAADGAALLGLPGRLVEGLEGAGRQQHLLGRRAERHRLPTKQARRSNDLGAARGQDVGEDFCRLHRAIWCGQEAAVPDAHGHATPPWCRHLPPVRASCIAHAHFSRASERSSYKVGSGRTFYTPG